MTAGTVGKRAAIALACCALVLAGAHAQPPTADRGAGYRGAMPPWQATPDRIVRTGIDRLTGFLIGVPTLTEENLGAFLEHEIAPLFDFPYMARWAAGTYHRRLDDPQRDRLATMLRQLFLDALARNLGTYAQPLPRVDVLPARYAGAREARVFTRVVGAGGMMVRLEFRLYWGPAGWKVYDVVANGASAVAYYRRHFNQLLRRRGPAALDP